MQSPVLATVELSVCPSVRHTLALCQDHEICTDGEPKDTSFGDKKFIQKFETVHPASEGVK